jgi:glucosyl-dolichyl phosphate glucuronosyltransferase
MLSVIITSYSSDRLRDMCQLINTIKDQTYKHIETVIVVEKSEKLFAELSEYAEKIGVSINIIFSSENLGLSGARNLGFEKSTGDIVAFVDDDVVLTPKWAWELVNTFSDESIVGVTGPAQLLWEDNSYEWFPEEFDWLVGGTNWFGSKELVDVRNAWGMNLSFRRQVFADCHGFKTNFGLNNANRSSWADPPSEDVDFSFRVKRKTGKRIVFNPKMIVGHKIKSSKLSLTFIIQRSYSVGYQRRMIHKLYPSTTDDDTLVPERNFIKNVSARFIHNFLHSFPKEPKASLLKVTIVFVMLTFTGLGYFLPLSQNSLN